MKARVHYLKISNTNDYNEFEVSYLCILHAVYYIIFMWKGAQIGCTIDMKIGWALDMIGWACAQPFPTLATPLVDAIQKL